MLAIETITVDVKDRMRVATFWAMALNWEIDTDEDGDIYVRNPSEDGPDLLFLVVPEHKSIKNRLHLDLSCDDQEEEVNRLESLGATRVDIGQGDARFVVLADIEGNEFCVLAP